MKPLLPNSLVRKLSFFLVLINLGMGCLGCYLLFLFIPAQASRNSLFTILVLSIFACGSLLLLLHVLFALSVPIILPPEWLWGLTILFSLLLTAMLGGLGLTLFFTGTSIVLSIGAFIALDREKQRAKQEHAIANYGQSTTNPDQHTG